jgi:predicted metal-dependent HD superfamily phosphohydrolase
MTATHLSDHGIDKNSIEQVFLDLDMSIVASDEHKYLEYA